MRKRIFLVLIVIIMICPILGYAEENEEALLKNHKSYNVFIDLNDLTLNLVDPVTKKFEKKYPISIGKKETPSPIGNWHVKSKANLKGPFGGYWLGLDVPWDTFGIHGTNRPDSIGSMASHGCFRMNNYNIIEVFNSVDVGASVIIYPGPNFRFSIYSRIIKPNDSGYDVYEVQRRLKDLGYFKYDPNGIYGYTLEQAVLNYKFNFGLGDTPEIDGKFLDSIGLPLMD